MTDTRERYSGFTLTLHWVTVVLVVTQLAILWISADLPRPDRGVWMTGHKSVGLVILFLTLARLGVRLFHPAIALPTTMPAWEKLVSRATHGLFYVLLIALPLGGWTAATASGRPIQFFWSFPWPAMPFVPLDKGLGKAVMELHEIGGKVLIGLIILHVLGALKHYLLDKDNVLQRMIPFLPRRAA